MLAIHRFLPYILMLVFSLGSTREISNVDESLSKIFPNAQIEVKNIALSQDQLINIEKVTGVKLNSKVLTWYIAKKGNRIIGYAYVDKHKVRTKPETVLYAIDPQGRILVIEVLAFNEPLEYMPEENWLKNFQGKTLDKDELKIKRDIPNITGATITAKAITDNTRKVLGIWQVLFGGRK